MHARRILAGFGLVLALAPAAVAHHSFAAEFDGNKRVSFQGVVTKVEWTNPHTYFYVDVKDDSGRVVNWAFETAGPNLLARLGWKRDSLKVGDRVTVVGYPAWDGAKIASARTVVLADGHKVFAGSAVDGGPQP
ncbi:MAG TPA: DUF6152 family protein [Bryobacteraceae bacterium]|jgi:hypothetical protein